MSARESPAGHVTHVVCTKLVESLCNFDLLSRVKVGICKLFSFSQGTLDYLEIGNVGEKVADRLVWIPGVVMRVLARANAREAWMAFAKLGMCHVSEEVVCSLLLAPFVPFTPLEWPFTWALLVWLSPSSVDGHILVVG